MPEVTFKPTDRSIDVAVGTALLDVAHETGVGLESPCGGQGVCGQCVVRVREGELEYDGVGMLSEQDEADGYVLACCARLLETPVTVEVLQPAEREGGRFVEAHPGGCAVPPERFPTERERKPMAQVVTLQVAQPEAEDGLSDLDRLTRAISERCGQQQVTCPLAVVRDLAPTLRVDSGRVVATVVQESGCMRVIALEPGNQAPPQYGLAVDVGTTTIAIQLIRLPDAIVAVTRSDYNDQIECGLDVISRINYARKNGRLQELQRRVLGTINRLVKAAAEEANVTSEQIRSTCLSGNTTMIHLLLGLDPEQIRLAPYVPTIHSLAPITAQEAGLDIHPRAPMAISPCVGSYVGGDITAGLLCTEMTGDIDAPCLYMDIGTNGELVIGNRNFLMACACSAGPAFEGGGIGSGMRAADGAIDLVSIDPDSGLPHYTTIGDKPARGICGSGMIALLSELFCTGWIDAAGKFQRNRSNPAIEVQGRRARYRLVRAEKSASNKAIYIDEFDIENIIRAKAAVYAGCGLMLKQLGLEFGDLSTIYVAGGFGRFLDLERAINIGLLPDVPRDRFRYLGNASLIGTHMTLVSSRHRDRLNATARRMTYLELNTDPAYMDQYTAALFLPHTDLDRFPSVRHSVSKR
ncbi:MAG: ASKHA domain-containing protein [Acidiferrobacterales bacterium]